MSSVRKLSAAGMYYLVKPLIPRWLQICLRRPLVRHHRLSHKNTWPVDPRADQKPANWKGWPDGRKFALVLTHDVEKAIGYSRIPDLVAIEEQLGFISSYNMVPRRYEIMADTREMLLKKGFEVGVHGLYHDGKLYQSLETFRERANIINGYLADWNASGFRAPSMHHNLNWHYYLNIEYDASTFDTDPFEPQSDGVKSIFPFIVTACQEIDGERRCKDYVELPYTLVQDFSMFILLGEKTIDVWKRKVDWIAEKGGMVLLNTHPDYMCFGNNKPRIEEYSSSHYEQLLQYIKERYAGQYWHVLPRDMAAFWKTFASESSASNSS